MARRVFKGATLRIRRFDLQMGNQTHQIKLKAILNGRVVLQQRDMESSHRYGKKFRREICL